MENYASTLPKYLGMFVKQAGKTTLLEIFEEAIKVEKISMRNDFDNHSKYDNFTHRRTKCFPKKNSDKRILKHSM